MNATVTLSLGEIDALRNEIIEAKAKLAESEAHQKMLQVQVTESWRENQVESERVYDYDRTGYMSGMGHSQPSYRAVMRDVSKSITKWYNLDDIMGLLRKEAEDAVTSQVTDLKATISRRENDITAIQLEISEKKEENRKLTLEVAELRRVEVEKTLVEALKKQVLDKAALNAEYLMEITKLRGQFFKKNFWSRLFGG